MTGWSETGVNIALKGNLVTDWPGVRDNKKLSSLLVNCFTGHRVDTRDQMRHDWLQGSDTWDMQNTSASTYGGNRTQHFLYRAPAHCPDLGLRATGAERSQPEHRNARLAYRPSLRSLVGLLNDTLANDVLMGIPR